MTIRPVVWLLDIDGVVNASRPGWGGPPRRTFVRALGIDFRITWAPALVTEITRLHASGCVQVCLASTWNGHADVLGRALRWSLPLAFDPRGAALTPADAAAAKLAAALDVVAAGGRLIWTDDEAIPTEGGVLETLRAAGALLIAPRPRRGSSPATSSRSRGTSASARKGAGTVRRRTPDDLDAALVLAEYQTLKAEQLARIGTRDNLLYATYAAIVGVALAGAGQARVLLALPAAGVVLGWTYLANDKKITQIQIP